MAHRSQEIDTAVGHRRSGARSAGIGEKIIERLLVDPFFFTGVYVECPETF
jgi:hypothetical protein